ncbi:S-methyl-5-thioribose kinase [Planotetraspora sp. A-T 1434]|uniref:S-methyl-5-thioribose kinase n=1 Tax=Planotetraspora sp. A-T 1434 TaxID=2979219 RepID=UPI0021C1FAAD|nr:S-methyl-5-thioribose kinase [Planotetraspora sp. A-T 1434]MCT9930103.1 S-methyl-5-thioribose kinase [Planotetraspora sp. A-T 1434]
MTATVDAGQSYELLSAETVPAYIAGRPALRRLLDPAAISQVREVGDGNMNLVFVVEAATGQGLVLKQALPYVRVDPTWPITPERNGYEARALLAHNSVAPGLVPAFYDADEARHVVAMEDLSDHRVWRGALNEGLRHEGVAADLGRYVARVAFGTSVFGLGAKAHKAALAASVNPELCEITEDLVFTEPYIRHEHNRILPANEADVAAYAGDPEVRTAIGAAKLAFMTHAEALIHGDLHTGSVLVRAETPGIPASTRAFDIEFAFYGPVGFDIGALWGNYLLAAARGFALGDEAHAAWVLGRAEETWRTFREEFTALWPDRADPRVFGDGVLEGYLAKVYGDAAAAGAAKAARRVIGFSRVTDIETLPEEERVRAIRGVLRAARLLLVEGAAVTDPAALFDRAGETLSAP